jgi:hypothetical protein
VESTCYAQMTLVLDFFGGSLMGLLVGKFVEADGPIHLNQCHLDQIRDSHLQTKGFGVPVLLRDRYPTPRLYPRPASRQNKQFHTAGAWPQFVPLAFAYFSAVDYDIVIIDNAVDPNGSRR